MRFDLSDEQKMLQASVRTLLAGNETVMARVDSADGFNATTWAALCRLGLPQCLPREEDGGLGMGLLTLAVACEEAGYAAASVPLIDHCLATYAIGKEHDGPIAVLAWNDAPGLWHPDQWQAEASGEKSAVLFAEQAEALLVGLAGGQLAVAAPASTAPIDSVDRTQRLWQVTYRDAAPLEGVDALRLYQAAVILQAADAFGAARRMLDMTTDYAQTRVQFGKPIGAFQAVKHQLADMAAALEPCRALLWYAAHAWDKGLPDAPRTALVCNAHITDMAVSLGRSATELHGGIAMTWDYPLHVYLKRAMHARARFGSPNVLRCRAAQMAGWTP